MLSLLTDDPNLKVKMLSKWIPEHEGSAQLDCEEIIARILKADSLSTSLRESIERLDVSDYARLTLVWRYNSFGHHTDTNALCMYDITSMMAHSCGSTGVWHFGSNDSFCLRARVALNQGDEITISYLSDDDLFKSTSVRRQKSQGWLFSCNCVRCTSSDSCSIDYSRGFRCPTCTVGTVFVSPQDEMSPCCSCASKLSPDLVKHYLELEPLYADRLACTEKDDLDDVQAVLTEARNLFSDNHWIMYGLDSMVCDHLKKANDNSGAKIDVLQRRLSFLTRTFPMANYTTGWLLEEIGDWYIAEGSRAVAESFYERAYWTLRIMCGPDHPFTEGVQTKWDSTLEQKSYA